MTKHLLNLILQHSFKLGKLNFKLLYAVYYSLFIGDTSATEPEAHVHNAGSHPNVQTQDDTQK